MRLLVALVVASLPVAPVQPSGAEPAAPSSVLTVPFLPQTEALCGGAAAAMVFRYWGQRHADVQQFAPLVDRKAGGIADTVLVRAIEQRGWNTRRLDGTIAALQAQIEARRPVLALIEDRPNRYHFVVVVAADRQQVAVHDPAWGPSRRYETDAFVKVWKPTGYWALLITPKDTPRARASSPVSPGPARTPTACDRAIDDAVAAVRANGLGIADAVFGEVRSQCPGSSRPVSELAGIRFTQHRFDEAAALSRQAVAIDRSDEYAWDVLGSSRFVQGDVRGAIQAWNAIQRPQLDSVAIDGLARMRYASLATSLPLEANRVVRAGDFALAARRLDEHPAFVATRLGLTPDDEGWAVARVAVVERAAAPRGWAQWSAAGAATAINRELRADVPGWTGQGDVWSVRWRWWQNRPALTLGFTTPASSLGGVWTVEGSWQSQRYATEDVASSIRERRTRAGIKRTDWATQDLRYEISGGLDVWDGAQRAIEMGIHVDRRFARDRISVEGSGRNWSGLNGTSGFRAVESRVTARSSREDRGFVALALAGGAVVSRFTPMSEWPGAGDVGERSPLLRAHPLTTDGIVTGDGFGRGLIFGSFEPRQWLERPALVRLGLAAFVDIARAWHQADISIPGPLMVDAGVGVRIRLPGQRSILRVDYGRGLRDSANALTIGWQR